MNTLKGKKVKTYPAKFLSSLSSSKKLEKKINNNLPQAAQNYLSDERY